MNALNAPAREATKVVAGFMHFLANCLEETAGAEKSPASSPTTIHIDTATLHVASAAETLAALRAELGVKKDDTVVIREKPRATTREDVERHRHQVEHDAQITRDQIAARRKLERSRRRPAKRGLFDALADVFRPDRGPHDQKDYALAGRK